MTELNLKRVGWFPKQVQEFKQILKLLKSGSIRAVRVKTNGENTKFKVRCAKYLYTYICADKAKAEELKKAIPKDIHVVEIAKKAPKAE
ncbi:ribosomal L38e family protein [Entamoeba nuttalli P19]|uniref:Ribosomal L38e family protein n=1 Tax=Entamoeba nuttalli (strain P19) TaxID=1076696 RepID=K2H3J3_ENTNP|nr:ribosomal L38e family protein [Entamoeba nuttalli P19]EKE37009.1 ribosomal L38e family protein [Entamoeba nuttalli P19]|eukprot:XP_008860662.1 ribosomal L38e family protein [Entamoeba nuttalli P19]